MNNNRLEIFGDSILKGVIYQNEAGRYRLYGSTLEDRLAQQGINVRRNCRMGATIDAGLSRMQKQFEKEGDLSDTTVLLEFGGNDSDFDWRAVSESPDADHFPKTSLERFRELYSDAIRIARSHGAEVAVATLVPIDAEKYMKFISRGLNSDNILHWLGDVSMLYRWHEEYNRTVENIAEKHRCPIVDLRRTFLLSHSFTSLICDDGIHPTTEGHGLIEDKLVSTMGGSIAAATA
ncbi:MAG: SGNH/GDSL hydrolase family protein [Clostridia bacterium]|nr:SGNH/GDSL hydrolase family protein [Clostridia bacterium]